MLCCIRQVTAATNVAAESSSGAGGLSAIIAMNGDSRSLVDVKSRIADDSFDKSRY